MTLVIGRLWRFQSENAGNQSSGETSMATLSQSHAKHSALTTFHGSLGSRSSAIARILSLAVAASTPVNGSVTSVRHFHSMYRASFVSVATGGGGGGFGIHDSPRAKAHGASVNAATANTAAPIQRYLPLGRTIRLTTGMNAISL